MRNVHPHHSLIAVAVAVILVAGGRAGAQDDEIAALRKEIAALKRVNAALTKDIEQMRQFNERLCKTLRDETIIIFATEPKTEQEKLVRAIEVFKASIKKARHAMASRNPIVQTRADQLRAEAVAAMKTLDPAMMVRALTAECEAANDDPMTCSALMTALGTVGKDAVLPYFTTVARDKNRAGSMRRIAAEAMLAVDRDRAIDVLIPVAGDYSDPEKFQERFMVIYALSETRDPRVEAMLLKGAKHDPDRSARCHHINGLAHYKTAAARAALEWVIANDDYEHARTNALQGLHRMLGDEAAYPVMKKLSQEAMLKDGKSPDFRVRNAAYQTMNRIKLTLEREGKPVPGEAAEKESEGKAAKK